MVSSSFLKSNIHITSKVKAFALAAAALVGVQAAPAQAARCIDDANAAQLAACKESLRFYTEYRSQEPMRVAFAGPAGVLMMLGAAAVAGQQQTHMPAPVRDCKNNL